MKTAEEKAFELYPDVQNMTKPIAARERKAFIEGAKWMEQKQQQKEAIIEMMKADEKDGIYDEFQDTEAEAEAFADSHERRGCAYWNGLYRGYINGATRNNRLREAAEKVVVDYANLKGTDEQHLKLMNAISELVKALK